MTTERIQIEIESFLKPQFNLKLSIPQKKDRPFRPAFLKSITHFSWKPILKLMVAVCQEGEEGN
ncbi:hypothetical protein BG32_11420, partial [Mesotoga sp. HF07.pep.5.2.highcov]